MTSAILSLLSLLAPLGSPAGWSAQASDWTALRLPSPTESGPRSETRPLTADGYHIYIDRAPHVAPAVGAPMFPAELVIALLESRAREAGENLTVLPGSPPLLVRGPEAAVESARATLDELDAAGASLDFLVDARLIAAKDDQVLAQYRGKYRPGELIEFGERETQSFLASYEVDVATDSGVAAPTIGVIETGRRISFTVHRVNRGTRFFVMGTLDFAELDSLVEFDTDAPDLGVVQQPAVDSLQATFSAWIGPGEGLEIAVTGSPLDVPDFRIVLQFENARPNRDTPSLELLDLSFLAAASPRLPRFALANDEFFREAGSAQTYPAIPTRAITSLSSERRGSTGLYASNRALLLDQSKSESAARALDLIAAYEKGRLASGRIKLSFGQLSVDLPSTSFAPTRVSVGRERTVMSGYQAEIAPESWMPSPRVERFFDGLVFDAEQASSGLRCGAHASSAGDEQVLDRFSAGLGRLQLAARAACHANLHVAAGAPPAALWPKSAHFAKLSVTFSDH